MVKPMKWTKTVTTGVLIASCITSTLPTQAFAMQANDYAEEFQAFVEGVENNKTDDAIADQAEQGTDQAAPVQPGAPAEQAAPAPQPTVPAASGETAPQGEPAAPAEDAQTSASPSAGVTEVDGKSDVAKKDELDADKVAGDKKEVAAEATDKAYAVEPAAETTAEATPAAETVEAAAQEQVLGTLEELFPCERLQEKLKNNGVPEKQPLKASDLEQVKHIDIQPNETINMRMTKKDCENLRYLVNLETLSIRGEDDDNAVSWVAEDPNALWASISKMQMLNFLALNDPNIKDSANLVINVPLLPKLTALQLADWTVNPWTGKGSGKVFQGSTINKKNLPALRSLDIAGTSLDNWSGVGTITTLTRLGAMKCGIEDVSFLSDNQDILYLDLSYNKILDASAAKGALASTGNPSLIISDQRRIISGGQKLTLHGGQNSARLPFQILFPGGIKPKATEVYALEGSGTNWKKKADGKLPAGVSYDSQSGEFTITREAAKALQEVNAYGTNAKMVAIGFEGQLPNQANPFSGKVFLEIAVTDQVPNNPPVIEGAKDVIINQGDEFKALEGVTAKDPDKGDSAKLTVDTSKLNVNKPGAYKVTYTATDKHNATVSKEITVTVNGVPTITGVAAAKTIVQGDAFNPMDGVIAQDHEQGTITNLVQVSKTYDVNTPGTYTITFTVTDNNKATATATMQLTVKANQAPVINASNLTIVEGDKFDAKKHATATDAEDGTLPVTVVKSDVNPDKYGEYHVTYSATDKKGLKTEKTITVTVLPKMIDLNFAPVIEGAVDKTIVQGDKFDKMAGVTATDKEQGKLVPTVTGNVDVNTPGTYKLKYEVVDNKGAKTVKEITVTVLKNQAPVINAQDVTITEGDKFDAKKHATATDAEDGTLPVTVVKSDVNPDKYGEYHVTYSATDKKGLKTEKTITVTVNPRQQDLNAAPTFEGLSDKTIMLGDEFDPKAGVTAKDAEDGEIEFTVKGKVDSTKVGAYELTYTAKDSKGAAVTKVITVTVKQPVVGLNQAPTINAADVTIVQGETFDPMSGVTATDPEDGELKFTVTGAVDTEVYGEYELVYQAIDKDGAKATKTIKVIVLPRLVSLNAVPTIDAHSVTIVQGEAFDPKAGVTANDAEDGKLAVKLESGSVDTATPGEYILVYSATDSAGARVTKTITVKVVAKQAEAGKPQKPGKPQQAGKPQKPGKPNGTAQLPQTGDASMVAAGATGLMGVLALAAERLRRRRK